MANPTTPRDPSPAKDDPSPTTPSPFSWTDAHPLFVIILVGPDQHPFGIQKDFLCAKSAVYRRHFAATAADSLENVVALPEVSRAVFGLAQHYMYTGRVSPSAAASAVPYETYIGAWQLGHALEIAGLCDATLDAMVAARRATQRIPATPLLVQAWRDSPVGSALRRLVLAWAAEYMRVSSDRAEFAKSLPHEVLSELVVAMGAAGCRNMNPATAALLASGAALSPATVAAAWALSPASLAEEEDSFLSPGERARKSVHYLDDDDEDDDDDDGDDDNKDGRASKRVQRLSSSSSSAAGVRKVSSSKPGPAKGSKRRSSGMYANSSSLTTRQKLNFCGDLISRMLSGPGYWTRLVGPFRQPVDPVVDGVPDYFDKISQPMDLTTIKHKFDTGQYTSEAEFVGDVRRIFANCHAYWKPTDKVYQDCELLQSAFETQYAGMHKWVAKYESSSEEAAHGLKS